MKAQAPPTSEATVHAVAIAKPEQSGKSKSKAPTWRAWQSTIKTWRADQATGVIEQAGPALRRSLESGAFDAGKGSTLLLPADDKTWLLLVGLGDAQDVKPQVLLQAAAVAARKAAGLKGHRLVSHLHEAPIPETEPADRVEATVHGIVLGAYKFDRFLSKGDDGDEEDDDKKLDVTLLVPDERTARRHQDTVASARTAAEAQLAARDLVNTPGNIATPEHLAREARRVAKETGLKCTVLGVNELKRKKMHGILAVGQGSANPPRLIILHHNPKKIHGKPYKRVAVVGKGITFDTGGISIKPSDRMELMKFDKTGACVVISLMRAIARARLPVEVIGLAACAENMPSGSAYRPGDILTMGPGKTVEVLNTDAEGRMVLADALHHAGTFKPDAVVDLATLTGAIDVALGGHYSGLMSNNDELARRLTEAGEKTGERVWRLPIGPEYQEQIKGSHSDLVNIGGRSGGALTAAQFLANFAPKDTPWAHLDIAGTAWDDKDRPENKKGATGVGVRLMYRMLHDLAQK